MSSTDYGMFSEEILYTVNGIRRTRSLFKEMCLPSDEPVFTLAPRARDGLISIKDLYIGLCTNDPSEATFAEVVFGDITFWYNIRDCTWLQDHLKEWREAADIKRKSMAFTAMINEIKNDGKASFSAARFLIEEPWKKTGKRPTAKERKAKEETTTKALSSISSDVSRLKDEGFLQ